MFIWYIFISKSWNLSYFYTKKYLFYEAGTEVCFLRGLLCNKTPLTAKVEPGLGNHVFLFSNGTEEECTNDFAGYGGILTLLDKNA